MNIIHFFSKTDRKTIEKIFARLFSSEDGKKAIAYLQYITGQRVLAADTDPKILSYAEGQRALVGNILRIIENGQK